MVRLCPLRWYVTIEILFIRWQLQSLLYVRTSCAEWPVETTMQRPSDQTPDNRTENVASTERNRGTGPTVARSLHIIICRLNAGRHLCSNSHSISSTCPYLTVPLWPCYASELRMVRNDRLRIAMVFTADNVDRFNSIGQAILINSRWLVATLLLFIAYAYIIKPVCLMLAQRNVCYTYICTEEER